MVVAGVPYVVTILRGETKPAKATWLIWAVLDITIICGMYAKGTLNFQMLAAGVESSVIFCLALKYGLAGWTKLDKFCIASTLIGLGAWYLSGEALYGIVISLTIMIIGSLPTFVSAWKNPHYEDKWMWTISWFSSILAVIAIPYWDISNYTQPIVFLFIYTVMMYLLYIKPAVPRFFR